MLTAHCTRAAAAFRHAALAAGLLLAAGCTSVHSDARTFEGTRWQVTSINGETISPSDMYRIEFTGGRIGGRFGCNQFGGGYSVRSDVMQVGDVASTLIGCPEPAARHERQGLNVLGEPMRLAWESGTRLRLANERGSIGLELLNRNS